MGSAPPHFMDGIEIRVAEPQGRHRSLGFAKREISIGRSPGNDIVLEGSSVSKFHAKLEIESSDVTLTDLRSTNGTFVNGARLSVAARIASTDLIRIGEYALQVEAPRRAELEPKHGSPVPGDAPADVPSSPGRRPGCWQLQKRVHDQLIARLDLRRLDLDRLKDNELRVRVLASVEEILAELEQTEPLNDEFDREALIGDVINEALGLGPLEAFLKDESVSEIMVNRADQIYLERGGKLLVSEKRFSSNRAVMGVIERIVAPIGRRIDEATPLVDGRLHDGSRVNAIVPPLALKGPCLTIRKFKRDALKADDLVRCHTLTAPMAKFLELCVRQRKNVVISGGTGSGKTTTLNIISSFIPEGERIVTVEDAAELRLPQAHWIQLETRPPNLEGKGAITIRDLVKNCLRMRPDRIVVGECRSGEALDMLQAMNTGHDGSLTTLHANSPRDALARLETMVLMAGMELPVRAIREQIASAVQIIIQQTRYPDGTRKISYITEVTGMEGEVIALQDIFQFQQQGFGADGKVQGRFVATGCDDGLSSRSSWAAICCTASRFGEAGWSERYSRYFCSANARLFRYWCATMARLSKAGA